MSTATASTPITDPWSMDVTTKNGNGDYVLCPAGNYAGTIVGLFDVGHQAGTNKDGSTYDRRQLVLVFELAKKRPDGKPFVLAERYTWSMSNKSNFYGLACSLTGITFKDGDKFDPRKLLGMACMVQVSNTAPNDKGKQYHNIAGVAMFPEGLPAPQPSVAPVCWSIFEGTPLPECSWVPYVYGESVPVMVESSTEFKAGTCPRDVCRLNTGNGTGNTGTAAAAAPASADADNPF